MRTNKFIYTLALIVLSGSLVFTSCKKRKAFKNEDGQASSDNRSAQGEVDAGISDANTVISDDALLNGKTNGAQTVMGVLGTPCGLTIDTNGRYQGKITLNYNGTTCWNRTRTGQIKLTILNYTSGVRWKTAGAQLQIDYNGYKVTRASDGKSIELNGTAIITNVNGGTWYNLIFTGQPSLIHESSSSNLRVTFDGSATAVYNINRRFTYTFTNNPFKITCVGEGIGSSNSLSSLENYGTTRDGDAFTSQVKTPIIWNTTCGSHAPIQGEVEIKVDSKYFALNCLFGVDQSGNAVTVGANQCPYGFKVEWTYKKKTNKKIFGYW